MYTYEWDEETGGIKLSPIPPALSCEVRPVYYREMDTLGFDKHFEYEKSDAAPFMWAKGQYYFYRGQKIAQTSGGNCYKAPSLEVLAFEGEKLKAIDIDAMTKKNAAIMNDIEIATIKRVYDVYLKYRNKVDVFYVAFSGGKDSIVTLDLVARALPHDEFKVVFGDTGMEFPDTYETVNKVEAWCKSEGIDFLRAKSHLKPEESWRKFGPPASVLRWCCSVHKTAPQILKLREVTGKSNFSGMAFVGVRAGESMARSKYEYLSRGEKHSGQYNCNAILDWSGAEVYSYIFKKELLLNEAYKKGNSRVGCLVCPEGSETNNYWKSFWYKKECDMFVDIIKDCYKCTFQDDERLNKFIEKRGWRARKNNRDISLKVDYKQCEESGNITLIVEKPKTSWKEWIKTLGTLTAKSENEYSIFFEGTSYDFCVKAAKQGYEISFDERFESKAVRFVKYFKNVFRKAAACAQCKECVANCHNGCITMDEGEVKVSSNCTHCLMCHEIEKGCILFSSLKPMNEGGKVMETTTLNRYSTHGPKIEWIKQYFELGEEFQKRHTLGPEMYSFFLKMTVDSGIRDKDTRKWTPLAHIIKKLGLDNKVAWALMLVNLSYTRQINWYINNIFVGEVVSKECFKKRIKDELTKEDEISGKTRSEEAANTTTSQITRTLLRFLSLPFSKVGMGEVIAGEGARAQSFTAIKRKEWEAPDCRVIIYSLYKYSEGCGGYRHFTLSRLYNKAIESKGVSPAIIFGLDAESMKKMLIEAAFKYPNLISASFTLGLDNIDLSDDENVTAQSVVEELFS